MTKCPAWFLRVFKCAITLANDQLDAQIFNTFITILYMYMFRKISCSFSGGQIVFYVSLTVHLKYNLSQWPTWCTNFQYIYYNPLHVHVSSNILLIIRRSNCINTSSGIVTLSNWLSGAQVDTCAPYGHIQRQLTYIQSDDTRCCINTIWPPEDEQDIARNMYM
jgi:hypothetical protein